MLSNEETRTVAAVLCRSRVRRDGMFQLSDYFDQIDEAQRRIMMMKDINKCSVNYDWGETPGNA